MFQVKLFSVTSPVTSMPSCTFPVYVLPFTNLTVKSLVWAPIPLICTSPSSSLLASFNHPLPAHLLFPAVCRFQHDHHRNGSSRRLSREHAPLLLKMPSFRALASSPNGARLFHILCANGHVFMSSCMLCLLSERNKSLPYSRCSRLAKCSKK
jgi:hypothetical protein